MAFRQSIIFSSNALIMPPPKTLKTLEIYLFDVCGVDRIPYRRLYLDQNFNIHCLFFIRLRWCCVLGPCFVVLLLVYFLVEQSFSHVKGEDSCCSNLIACVVCVWCLFLTDLRMVYGGL